MSTPPAHGSVGSGPADRHALINRLLADDWRSFHPYKKWQGAHWRLLSLVELGDVDDARELAMLDRVLDWLTGAGHRRGLRTIAGRARRCASQEGNALLVACRLRQAADGRARLLAASLAEWQWPDGGWNCDIRPDTTHSSFHESLAPLRGLAAYHQATGDSAAVDAATRAADFFLAHGLFRSERTKDVIDPAWLQIRWPAFWHYDVLQGLRGVGAVGALARDEATEALRWLERQRRPDGTWRTSGHRYWKRPGGTGSNVEVVDWGPLADDVVTEQATQVLRLACGPTDSNEGGERRRQPAC